MKFKIIVLVVLVVIVVFVFVIIQIVGNFGQGEFVFIVINGVGFYVQDLGVFVDFIGVFVVGILFMQFVVGMEWNKFLSFGGVNIQWVIIVVQLLDIGFNLGEVNVWMICNINQVLGIIQNSQFNDGINNLVFYFVDIDNCVNFKVVDNCLVFVFGMLIYLDNGIMLFNGFFNVCNVIGI